MSLDAFLQIDLPAMAAALFATLACTILGNFLVLRRQSLMGDAIAHAVLPGIVVAFILVGHRAVLPMFLGALAAAVLAAILIELVKRYGRLESGAAMGVVFSIMFAAGIVLVEQTARDVHLDTEHVLFGQLETILWLGATDLAALADPATWAQMPRQVPVLAGVLALVALLVAAFWKELTLASFDPDLATALGFSAGAINLGLMIAVGVVAVAAFEAVGSILVIAMFICPAAAARLFTDRLGRQMAISLAFAAFAAIGGYLAAAFGPGLFGSPHALTASGMIAVMAGLVLVCAILFAPRYGAFARNRRARA